MSVERPRTVDGRPAARLLLRARSVAYAVPVAWWLAAIVLVSTLSLASFVSTVSGPIVFPDELVYGELARSIAAGHLPAVRGTVTLGYGVVAAALDAIPIRLGADLADGYAYIKLLNSFVMSLAAVPAYLIARRTLRVSGALTVALLTVLVPSMVLAALVMKESVFYPIFLVVVLLIVRVLERPTLGRQVSVLLGLGVAYMTRVQALVILPTYLCAICLKAYLDRRQDPSIRLGSTFRAYRPTVAVLAVGALTAAGVMVGRGASPSVILGGYAFVVTNYSPLSVARWSLINLADLVLYTGAVGLLGFVLGVAPAFSRRSSTPAMRAFAATSVSFVALFIVQIGAFSTTLADGERIHDRNLFPIVPLLLIGLVAWVERDLPRPWKLTVAAALIVAALPAMIPYADVRTGAWVDQIGIVFWLGGVVPGAFVKLSMLMLTGCAVVAAVLTPTRWRWLLVGFVAMIFLVEGAAAKWQAQRGGETTAPNPTWIDDAAGDGASVSILFVDPSPCASLHQTENRWIAFWRAEFFNRSVTYPTSVGTPQPVSQGLPTARVQHSGNVVLQDGSPLWADYLLLDSRIALRGSTLVAASRSQRLALWRVDGAVRLVPASQRRAVDLVCKNAGR